MRTFRREGKKKSRASRPDPWVLSGHAEIVFLIEVHESGKRGTGGKGRFLEQEEKSPKRNHSNYTTEFEKSSEFHVRGHRGSR